MSKKNKNNNNKKPRIEELLLKDADIRLKRFIEDIRHDPMFRHRVFYPVLYKQVNHTLRTEKVKDKNETLRIQEVSYEYYLFKAENFCANGETFLAVLLANGPMLPEADRLFLDDSERGLFNRNNRDLALRRTLTFVEMLSNETLFNFIFSSVIGENSFDSMRERFRDISQSRRQVPAHFNKYERINATNNAGHNMSNVLNSLRNFFREVDNQHVRSLLNFMTYMGDVRNIVTKFSYKPMSQDQLEALYGADEGYYLNDEQQRTLEHFNMLEEALSQKILEKVTSEHIEFYTEEIYNHYSTICAEINDRDPSEVRNIRESIKRKLAKTLTDIHTYTRNYISRSILRCSSNPQQCETENTYINRIIHAITRENDPERTFNRLIDGPMGFQNFIANPDDLATFIRRVFENDVRYINEICCNRHHEHMFTGNSSRMRSLRDRYTGSMVYGTNQRLNVTSNWVTGTSSETGGNRAWEQLMANIRMITEPLSRSDINRCLNYDSGALMESIYAINYIYEKVLNSDFSFTGNDASVIRNNGRMYSSIEDLLDDLNSRTRQALSNFTTEFINESDLLRRVDEIAEEEWNYISDALQGNTNFLSRLLSVDPLNRVLRNLSDRRFANCFQIIIFTRLLNRLYEEIQYSGNSNSEFYSAMYNTILNRMREVFSNNTREYTPRLNEIITSIENAIPRRTPTRLLILDILRGYVNNLSRFYRDQAECVCGISDIARYLVNSSRESSPHPLCFTENDIRANTEALMNHFFARYLKPVLVDFIGYALNNITFQTMRDRLEVDIVSKDTLHLSSLLDNRSAGLLTIDGAVYNDLANYTQILMADTFASLDLRNESNVTKFLNDVYHINFTNLIVLGHQYAYLHLNTIGNPYLYRGAQNKIPIRHIEENYEFLMGPRGLYNNLPNIKPPKNQK